MHKSTKLAALIVLVYFVGCVIGPAFDKACVEGRISQEQAEAINELEWEKCPSYNEGECRAEVNDRVIKRECSELSRKFFYWY